MKRKVLGILLTIAMITTSADFTVFATEQTTETEIISEEETSSSSKEETEKEIELSEIESSELSEEEFSEKNISIEESETEESTANEKSEEEFTTLETKETQIEQEEVTTDEVTETEQEEIITDEETIVDFISGETTESALESTTEKAEKNLNSDNSVQSGSYRNIMWEIDTNGKLTISGTGDFSNATGYDRSPWYSYRESIISAAVNVTGIKNASYMFYNCENLARVNLDNFDTSEVTNMHAMFSGCSSLTVLDVGNFNTENVIDMDNMFSRCSSLIALDISNFNTGNVTDMSWMFSGCSSLIVLDISNFNTGNVTNMRWMFSGCSSLTALGISNFNTENVTNMSCMFRECSSLTTLDVSNLNTRNVTDMSIMFYKCSSLTTLDVSNLNTRNVTDMSNMFSGCSSLIALNVSNLNTENVIDMSSMFSGCSSLTALDISNFDTENVAYMIWMFDGCSSLITLDVSNLNTRNVTYMSRMLSGCSSLTVLDISNFNTENVTGMDSMFSGCSSLTALDMSNFNTGNVTDMDNMFSGCSSLTALDVSNFNTENVTSMDRMFSGCSSLTVLDVNNFNTKSVTDMRWMFSGCSSLVNLNIGNFNTENVIDMYEMFSDCSSLTALDVSNFDTKNVECVQGMFDGCSNLITLDISNFDLTNTIISNIKPSSMFSDCTMLKTIYAPYNLTFTLPLPIINSTDVWYLSDGTVVTELPQNLSYSVVIKKNEIPKEENSILVFTTDKCLSVKTGNSMWLAFALLDTKTGLYDGEWKKMSIVVSDKSVIELSDYEKTEYGYSLEVIGKKEGTTNVVITDTSSGANITIQIYVYDEYVQTSSYAIDNMPSFYPNNKFEADIETNIYDLNGLYVNNYLVQKDNYSHKYTVSFDVYNSNYYYGAVDIYDKDGNWIGYEEIKKFSNISSLWDTGEQAYYLISDLWTGKMLTYEQASFSECTSGISFEVPENGYFTISNNIATSPGTFFSNAFDILFDAAATALDLALSDSVKDTAFDGFMDGNKKNLTEQMVEVLVDNAKEDETLQKVFLKSIESEIRKTTKKLAKAEMNSMILSSNDMYSEFANLAEDIMTRLNLIDKDGWKQQFKMATGIGESAFTKLSGPAGIALSGCFSLNKGSDRLLMAVQMAKSTDNTYVKVFSSTDNCSINQNGVIINSSGNIDSEAVLQVFRISNNDTVEVILNSNNPLERHELYNICFIKNDQLVQPNGKVTVYLPIPEGMNSNVCKVYRQEEDGSWAILDAHIEENYLVFETNHFSLYAIIGETQNINIYSLPTNTIYNEGDTLNLDGLIISINGKLISNGFICTPSVLSKQGTQIITVKYGCTTTEFEVTVESDRQVFSVIFNANGGSSIEEQIIRENEKAIEPLSPVKDGYIFTGWYLNGVLYDFNTEVTSDIILEAGWLKDGKTAPPTSNIASGSTVEPGTRIKLISSESAQIYYTLDETTPTVSSILFTEDILITQNTIIKAFAVQEGLQDSDVVTFIYNISTTENPDDLGDILPEDIPESGIPNGLWIAGIKDVEYTGKAIKPLVRVYDYKTKLTEKQDYTISYKNNINVNDATNESKAPSVVIQAKGNYSGKETATFKILAKDIDSTDFDIADITVNPNKKVQKPVPAVIFKGKHLSNKKDFTVTYPDTFAGAYKEKGTYSIKIFGKGNYTGERTINFIITDSNLITKAKTSKISSQQYTGKALTPIVQVNYGKTTLKEGKDYELAYRDNTDIGTATVIVKGKGDYSGQKTISFKIIGASINKGTVVGLNTPSTFNGSEITKNFYLVVIVNGNQRTLKEGQDYTVKYQNNKKAGNATLVLTGINGYSGTLKKTFKINAYDLQTDADKKVRYNQDLSVAYAKNGSCPDPVIYFHGTKLEKGKDYNLSYKNNKAVNAGGNSATAPTIIVKGKGNFTGTLPITFAITSQDLSNLTLTANDKAYKNRTNIFATNIKIADINGKTLSAGKDYDKNSIVYTYVDDVKLENGVTKKAGDNVEKTDIIPANTKIQVSIKAKAGGYYKGTAKGVYRIIKSDIKNAKISIPAQTYTGKAIVPAKSDITITVGGTKLAESEFEIVSCTNNMKKGKASITIKGKGNYGGTKTIKFTIKSKGFLWWWRR